jgi:hypothetical protein
VSAALRARPEEGSRDFTTDPKLLAGFVARRIHRLRRVGPRAIDKFKEEAHGN